MSFLTPKKSRAVSAGTGISSSAPVEPSTPQRVASKVIPANPFNAHYQATSVIDLEGLAATEPVTGPWSSAQKKKNIQVEDDVFTAWKDSDVAEQETPAVKEREVSSRVTLSQLLDNTVILEEFVKELAGIIQARRSLGIDAVRFFD